VVADGPTGTSGRAVPTVVVSRRVRPGRERDFERWVARLLAAAARAPGHLDAHHEPPDATHPDDWVVVYRFADADLLDRWLDSPERRSLIDDGADLIDGSAREQVVAFADDADPVTAVASVRVRPGHEEDYRQIQLELLAQMSRFPGFRRNEVFTPVPGVQDDHVVVFTFDTRAHLDAWLDAPERHEILARAAAHVVGDRTVNVLGGFAGWFAPAGTAPGVKRWKQACTVLLALFPTSLVITVVRDALVPDLAMVPAVFVGNAIGVAALSWLLMPTLTRWLDPWLRR
jgi:uncharacterized protein